MALAQAKAFGFQTVSCSSTGNLANAVAAQAARQGFDASIFIPADLEPAKILGTQIFGAHLVRIAGNYDQVNRLCSQIGERYQWGFVNINLRPYYAEGSKTVGYEIAEQLGWRLPDNVVVPMAGGSLITKIHKAFRELIALGLVESKPVRFFGAQATGCSPISPPCKSARTKSIPRSRRPSRALSRSAILPMGCMPAGSFAPAAGGPRTFPTRRSSPAWSRWPHRGNLRRDGRRRHRATPESLIAQGRIRADEETVICVTGNGLKTTDALAGGYSLEPAIEPRLAAFEKFMGQAMAVSAAVS